MKNELNIVQVKVKEIFPYENNAKKHDSKQIANVAESIKQFGFRQPIVLDKNNVIIIGHCRWLASKKLKLETVPCHYAEDLSEEQVVKLRNLDNKLNESEWDFALLKDQVINIDFTGFDIDWGIPDLEEEPAEIVEDEIPEVDNTVEPITKRGDIWQLGEHRLMCGDSTDKATVEKLMDGKQADLLLTDPPYNVDYTGATTDRLKIENDSMKDGEFLEFLTKAFQTADNVMKKGASFYIWYADVESYNFIASVKSIKWKLSQILIWVKNSLILGRKDYHFKHEPCLYGWKEGAPHNWYSDRTQTTVLEFNRPSRNGEHPTMKPIDLICYQIKNSSKKNDVVLDVFGGSGTTLIACEQLNRKCYTTELDPKYCDVIIKRWENLTGKKAVKIK